MTLPRYPAYRHHETPWLGSLPAHWDGQALKRVVAKIESGVSVNAVDEPAVVGGIGVLKTSCVYTGHFDPAENKAVVADELDRVACPVKAQTLIVSRMNTPALVGAAGLVSENAENLFLPDRLWQVHFTEALPAFVHYWTASPAYRAQVEMACAGTSASMQNLSQDDFLRFVLPLPSMSEQAAITTFLDHETVKIDALIAEQEKLITLLAEKRQATISRAVTRGLNLQAPMKDSGVPWLGEVPAHWAIKRMKQLVVEGVAGPYGSSLTKEMYTSQGYRVYGQQQVIPGNFSIGDYYISEEKFAEMSRYVVRAGDLLVSVMGTIGRAAVVPVDAEPGIINPRLVLYRINRVLVQPNYMQMFLSAPSSQRYFALAAQGTTMEGLNMSSIGSLWVAVPPLHEQGDILAFVQAETERLATAAQEVESALGLLKERRSALIAAAVTGQIDVRGVTAA